MYKYLIILLPTLAISAPYIEVGLGVPLTPDTGYMPDMYGVASFGYVHHLDEVASIDIGFVHRSLTGTDRINDNKDRGDNAIETKLRFEFK